MADANQSDIPVKRKRPNNDAAKASRLKWLEKRGAEYALSNREKQYEAARRWRANNPEKAKAMFRAQYLRNYKGKRKRLRLTPDDFKEMLTSQGNRCAICRSAEPWTKKGWHIDHCHASGFVRGILCHHCNMMLGNARDNPQTLQAGIAYLAAPPAA